MRTLLVVFHSRTGAARQMARAAAEAAVAEAEVRVRLLPAEEAGAGDVLAADGYLFAAPEMLGSLSGGMKDFFDRCYYPAQGHVAGRPYAAMIAAGSDGEGAARQLARIVLGWRLKPITSPLIVGLGVQTPEAILAAKRLDGAALAPCVELGHAFGAGLGAGIF